MPVPVLTSNLLRQLIPLNTFLEQELQALAKQSKITFLSAKQTLDLQQQKEKLYLLQGHGCVCSNGLVINTVYANTEAAHSALNRSRSLPLALVTQSDCYLLWVDLTHHEQQTTVEPKPLAEIKTPKIEIELQAKSVKIAPFSQEQLLSLPLFQSVFQQHGLKLLAQSRQIHGHKGQILQRQNEVATVVYVLLTGQAVEFDQQGAKRKLYRRLVTGDVFGHMALVSQQPHQSHVVLLEKSLLLKIPARAFLAYCPHILTAISQRHARDINDTAQVLYLDVRTVAEYQKNHIYQSLHLSLTQLHYRWAFLQKKHLISAPHQRLIVYSNQQKRAEAAAVQLYLQGVRCDVLRDGFCSFPPECTAQYEKTLSKQQFDEKQQALFSEVEQLLADHNRPLSRPVETKLLKSHSALLKAELNKMQSFLKQNHTPHQSRKIPIILWLLTLLLLIGLSAWFNPLS